MLKLSKRLFCESGGPNNQVPPCRLFATVRLLKLNQGRRSAASSRDCRGCRVKSKGRIRSRPSNTKVPLQGKLPTSLRPVQCNHACTDTRRQSREKFHKKHRSKICQHSEGAVARWQGFERTANFEGDFGCFRGTESERRDTGSIDRHVEKGEGKDGQTIWFSSTCRGA